MARKLLIEKFQSPIFPDTNQMELHKENTSSNYIWGPLDIAGSVGFSRWRPLRKLKSPIRDFIRKEDRLERKRQL